MVKAFNEIKTIGIIGGGQLARMMIPYAKQLGLKVVILDPSSDCPCVGYVDKLITAGFSDKAGFLEVAKLADVITYEFEHIDVLLLKMLEASGNIVYPSPNSLEIIQDKFTQKKALRDSNIAVPDFFAVETVEDLMAYYNKNQKPFMLKSRCGGYDGKGNFVVKNLEECAVGFNELNPKNKGNSLMIEPLVDFEREVSVIATRGIDGTTVVYPIGENVHKNSILDTTTVPTVISEKLTEKLIESAKAVMKCFSGVGTFCTEFFISEKTGEVLVNEVAPRVHNSGHYSIEACRVSQFENHIRAVVGLKPSNPELVVPAAVMKNIIADYNGVAKFSGLEAIANLPDTNVHIYGKTEGKIGRKMGHYTTTGEMKEVQGRVKTIEKLMKNT
ncbi:MAG: 5-(carboxyamino)imidazole ribonucleotide synthase [Firmicutes bacterium]|nr:5-(carboxyamino)imidazole ribonucleotide synthase [Bacillota bacterium]